MKLTLLGVAGLLWIAFFGVLVAPMYETKQGCTGYLRRAANASSVESAAESLDTAIAYLQREGKTNGWSYLFFRTPDCDVGYWYRNLVSARDELRNIPATASQLEKSNQLMKLREVLMEDGKSGAVVTAPPYLYWFPYEVGMWGLAAGILILALIATIWLRVLLGYGLVRAHGHGQLGSRQGRAREDYPRLR